LIAAPENPCGAVSVGAAAVSTGADE